MYILCFDQKNRLRGDFGVLQNGPKGVISEIGVYVYILSMGKGYCRVENTSSFFYADHAPSMDRNWHGSSPRSIRARTAIAPISSRNLRIPPPATRAYLPPHGRWKASSRTPLWYSGTQVLDHSIIHSMSSYSISCTTSSSMYEHSTDTSSPVS